MWALVHSRKYWCANLQFETSEIKVTEVPSKKSRNVHANFWFSAPFCSSASAPVGVSILTKPVYGGPVDTGKKAASNQRDSATGMTAAFTQNRTAPHRCDVNAIGDWHTKPTDGRTDPASQPVPRTRNASVGATTSRSSYWFKASWSINADRPLDGKSPTAGFALVSITRVSGGVSNAAEVIRDDV